MAYTPFVDVYKRSPFPALPGSNSLWFEQELRKLENVLQNHTQNLQVKYGAFQDNTDQFAAAINTPYSIRFDTVDFSNGVERNTTDTSKIVLAKPGVYDFQFSLQLNKANSNLGYVWVWPRINGVDIPDTATKIALSGSTAETVAAWNFVLRCDQEDYFQLMWATNDTGCHILHDPATAFCPAIPSAILTVTQVA